MFNQDKSKYAFVKVFGEYGYGHMHATIYNLTEKMYGGPQLIERFYPAPKLAEVA